MKKSTIRRSVVAAAAVAAVAAGSLAPAPAEAAVSVPVLATCAPGEGPVGSAFRGASADCSAASPSLIAAGADALIGWIVPDVGFKLSDLNMALAMGVPIVSPGKATISGSGFTTAVGISGTGQADAGGVLSGAIAVGLLGGTGEADSTFGGISLAAGVGGTSTAHALPFGFATSVGIGYDTSATAFGGFASAAGTSPLAGSAQTVCTALYATASVRNADGNVSSCTSVLFIFQQSQQGDGPVVYAIKNPFSLGFTSPLAGLLSVLEVLPLPEEVTDLLDVGFMPVFTEDLVRVVMTDGGPTVESDLFGSKADSAATAPSVLAAKSASMSDGVGSGGDVSSSRTTADVSTGSNGNDEGSGVEAPAVEATADAPAETETETSETGPAESGPAETGPTETEPAETESSAPAASESASDGDESSGAETSSEDAPASDESGTSEEAPTAA
ncbi:hypothetical protein L5G32_11860 [Gordonia sp. HY002]|uniref:hypothetical protein n=1 Tax=Gordonia zhenghanii TaxID=2911516 RepID=UPI001EEF8F3B|nr:hypothetical protein [Gordonia zhenghanii]MCF8570962.1 hypothetical protein [Gordonia zhenghanii]MCF8604705.1 hypothetical protein [Gordonia zhenghanii]